MSKLSPCLPDESVIELISWLPVKSILQYRTVCRNWKNLIDNSYFFKKHLSHAQNSKFVASPIYKTPKLFISDFNGIPGTRNSRLEKLRRFPAKFISAHFKKVLGTCNGLICLLGEDPLEIILWNPLLRKIIIHIPPQPEKGFVGYYDSSYGFGYDKIREDYKIIWMEKELCEEGFGGLVYSFKSNTWRLLNDNISYGASLVSTRQRDGVYVNNRLYWVVTNKYSIIGLDLATEKFQEVPLPAKYGRNTIHDLGILKDCLCLSSGGDYNFDIWLMNGDGSWTKFMNLSFRNNLNLYAVPITYHENGQDKCIVMFDRFNFVMFLDVETQSVIKKIKYRSSSKVFSYVETLELHSQEKWARQGLKVLNII